MLREPQKTNYFLLKLETQELGQKTIGNERDWHPNLNDLTNGPISKDLFRIIMNNINENYNSYL